VSAGRFSVVYSLTHFFLSSSPDTFFPFDCMFHGCFCLSWVIVDSSNTRNVSSSVIHPEPISKTCESLLCSF
jgi:hypothetical protein